MKNTLLILFFLLPLTLLSQQFEGTWYSSFMVMGNSMRMNLEVSEKPEVEVLLINPNMGGSKVTCDEASINGLELSFKWSQRGLNFKGELEDGVINGTMQQSGISWEVTFTRTEQAEVLANRPQEPQPPFNYTTDSLEIANGEVLLGASLTLPKNFNESTPIVIIVSGSGAQNRNCAIAGHQPFWVLADHLAKNEIASVRFDDRGTGTSTGNYEEASLMDLASDAEVIARYVRKRLKYKKNPLGMLGHSEGGMHTLIAANNYKKIDFLIQLATVGTSGKEVLVQQQYDIPIASGEGEVISSWNKKLFADMSHIVSTLPQDAATDSLTTLLGKAYENAPEEFDKSSRSRLQFIMGNIVFMNNTWMREFLAFQTKDYLEKIDLPVLAIHGGQDIQVAPKPNSAGFARYENAQCEIMEGLNHLMQHCTSCSIQEYGEIEETISPEVLELISAWVLEVR